MAEQTIKEDLVMAFIKQAEKLCLIHYIDLTTLYIETPSKPACIYIIENYQIDTQQVKNLIDDEGIDEELLWKLQLIDERKK